MKYLTITLLAIFTLGLACTQTAQLSEAEKVEYTAQGDSVSQLAFKALSGRLKQAIQDSGLVYAVQYCNLAALPIMDSVSQLTGAEIGRTSTSLRNTDNEPNNLESKILAQYQTDWKEQQPLNPVVSLQKNNKIHYAAPIMMMPLCLNCHGEPGKDISEEVMAQIKEKYPKDMAIGYHLGDWRGIWSITMDRKQP